MPPPKKKRNRGRQNAKNNKGRKTKTNKLEASNSSNSSPPSSDLETSVLDQSDIVNSNVTTDEDSLFEVETPNSSRRKSVCFAATVSCLEFSPPRRGRGRKRSYKGLSANSSPYYIPLNDDGDEHHEEENTDQEEEVEAEGAMEEEAIEPPIAIEPQEASIMKSMSQAEMQQHIQQCIQLNSENKITVKNAFALKLIDCMSVVSMNDDENNFAAMACQLDAGAKIYSHRVDAVHSDVMKLADSCLLAEVRGRKQGGDSKDGDEEVDEDNEGTGGAKPKTTTRRKKKFIAPREQITRQLKPKNPRDKYVTLEALPGDIFNKAKHDPTDLSLTLETHVPFWRNPDLPPTMATGTCQIIATHIEITNKRLGPILEVDRQYDYSNLPKLSSSLQISSTASNEQDNDAFNDAASDNEGTASSDEEKKVGMKKENLKEPKQENELDLFSIAKDRLIEKGNNPTRLDVLKTLFHKEGESEYHYLKMENAHYWAGPSYWKRPLGTKHLEDKKKPMRKKKEPKVIEYTDEDKEEEEDPFKQTKGTTGVNYKRSNQLARRTMAKWSAKKLSFPPDIQFRPQSLYMLYHAEITVNDSLDKDSPPIEAGIADDGKPLMNDEYYEEPSNSLDVSSDDNNEANNDEDQPDRSSSPNNATSSTEAGGLTTGDGSLASSSMDEAGPSGLCQAGPSGLCQAGPSGLCRPGPSTSWACDGYEGDNLVPMVKTVKVNPIKCVAKPNLVDMAHLKQVLWDVISTAIQNDEDEQEAIGLSYPQGTVCMRHVYKPLLTSWKLLYPTKDKLSFSMVLLCLLTLANEKSLNLEKDGVGDIVVSIKRLPMQVD